jgi:hypothetical protein
MNENGEDEKKPPGVARRFGDSVCALLLPMRLPLHPPGGARTKNAQSKTWTQTWAQM